MKYGSNRRYTVKEPVTIGNVSIDSIVDEDFENSHFWDKVRQMLFIYYLYDYKGPFDVQKYRDFRIIGNQMRAMPSEDREILESDWTKVRDFIKSARTKAHPEDHYPRLSHLDLVYLDISPKYPNPPRFRFKRSYVDGFTRDFFYGASKSAFPHPCREYEAFDSICQKKASMYGGLSVDELLAKFQIKSKCIDKSVSERIILKMFDSEEHKLNSISFLNKAGIIGKSIVLNQKDGPTEDMKLFKIDFKEIQAPDLDFYDSEFYSYFKDHQFVTIIFREPSDGSAFGDNMFIGFLRISFTDYFIQHAVLPTWELIRKIVNEGQLREIPMYTKDGRRRLTPKTNKPMSSLTFPKAKNSVIFVRGSGRDKNEQPLTINGI